MGKINVVVNNDYRSWTKAVAALPETFATEGTELYAGRNTLKAMEINGKQVVVKSFKRLGAFRSPVYKMRPTKAFRSYKHALMLLDLGVKTPEPIAYAVVEDNAGLPRESYYVSSYMPLPVLEDFFDAPEEQRSRVIRAFADFTGYLHRRGILFEDLNPTNVLVDESGDGEPVFMLVDINRMRFRRENTVGRRERFANIARVCYDRPELFREFASRYVDYCVEHGDIELGYPREKRRARAVRQAERAKRRHDLGRRVLEAVKHPARVAARLRKR